MKSLLARALVFAMALPAAAAGITASGPASAVPGNPDDKTILHVLNRIGFGARPGDVERVRQMGLAAYIDQQLRPDRIPDTQMAARLSSFETLTLSSRQIAQDYYVPAQMARRQAQLAKKDAGNDQNPSDAAKKPRTPQEMEMARKQREVVVELTEQKILRAAYSDRQLEEVLTDFWFNHFNVFAGKGPTQEYLTAYERDTIRPHVLGKFRDLLEATAKSPAMLFYLDNWQSADPNAADMREQRMRPGGRGLFFPRPPQRPNQNPNAQRQKRGLNENYGRELMELHTLGVDGGYTQDDVVNVARAFTGWTIDQPRQGGGFRFEPRLHDSREKVVLGHRIKAGGGESDGEQVLDILAKHPSTARFISTKLARRFVSDTPPPALVDRAAKRFAETDGDIREVVRTILTSPEFFSADAYRAKVKTPFEFVVSAVRATGTEVTDAMPLAQAVRQLGMPLYMCQPPTGYADRADAWVNTGALLNRMNFALQLVSGRMRGIEPGAGPVSAALANDVSPATASTIAKAGDPKQVAALTLGSPEFQRR
ncbi:MAG TPA: DUF1800 domain-containing protein [Vicinamibacterales bacterium]|jgi:uncharacterized protein (DUF1800 family)|nr:DUF1800 domain-containing protein [Vicinamibacterales bacterium]